MFTVVSGATPIQDLSDLKLAITTQSELDAAEFDNIHKAEEFYFKRRKWKDPSWFIPPFLQQIHQRMFDEVWEWAGKYRKYDVLPVGIEPYKIPTEMFKLSQDVIYWLHSSTNMPLLEVSARIHQRLAWVHPFPNGNGRFSRFVANLFLFSLKHPLPVWPTGLDKEGSHRKQYLRVLQEADRGHFEPLIEYLKNCIGHL